MSGAGSALMGIGSARGDDRAVAAAEMAISSPLLEASDRGRARRAAVDLRAAPTSASSRSTRPPSSSPRPPHPDANIIFGAVIDDALGDEVRVTVIAAGFDDSRSEQGTHRAASGAGGSPGGNDGMPTRGGNVTTSNGTVNFRNWNAPTPEWADSECRPIHSGPIDSGPVHSEVAGQRDEQRGGSS